MKAVIQDRYGAPAGALRMGEVDKPVPGPGEVLVKVHFASVHADVWHMVTGLPYVLRLMGAGFRRPIQPVPGTDMSGVVEAIGEKVTGFRAGDEVFGETLKAMAWKNGGAFAEYVCVSEIVLAHKPKHVSFETAACISTPGLIALSNLPNLGKDLAGKKVLVNGAAGALGAMLCQISKAFGADVTGVEHTAKLDLLKKFGVDQVVDYTREKVAELNERFDLIVDVASTLPFNACRRVLTDKGLFVVIGHDHYGATGKRILGSLPAIFCLMARSVFNSHLPKASMSLPSRGETMPILRDLLDSGKLTPVVDRIYPLVEAPLALARLQSGQAQGRILLKP